MVPERLKRLSSRLQEEGIEHALLTSFVSLRYFTGYRATVELEPSPITPLLGAFLWIRGEQPILYLADMIIALEPGMYFEGKWGMRLEYILRVTESGAEVLSKYRHEL